MERFGEYFILMSDFRIFERKKHQDNRGFFVESCPAFVESELGTKFVQDNLSFSKKGVVRGLHYQWEEPMGKLISVVKGSIIDYIVDVRADSETYGTSFAFELSDRNDLMLWTPPGFAHGFEALEDSYVLYKCSSIYSAEAEGSINIFDKNIDISLQTPKECVIMSKRDLEAVSFEDYCKDPKFFKEKI
jgi:dTDP-4-dehydrorhamnose 3,5-epimerase